MGLGYDYYPTKFGENRIILADFIVKKQRRQGYIFVFKVTIFHPHHFTTLFINNVAIFRVYVHGMYLFSSHALTGIEFRVSFARVFLL
jgi:hypothetical protein